MQQRSEEWFKARWGMITGSKLDIVMQKGKKEEFSQKGLDYAHEIALERVCNYYEKDSINSRATKWGEENEPYAIEEYELNTLNAVDSTGFIKYVDYFGSSPDGIVGSVGCIEVKCPYNVVKHMHNCINKSVPKEYFYQVHAQILVSGADWCDFVSYDPRNSVKSISIVRVERDSGLIDKIVERLEQFNDYVKSLIKDFKEAV